MTVVVRLRRLPLLLLLLHHLHPLSADTPSQSCIFPESAVRPFFFDVPAEIPAGTTINETFVEPNDAVILLSSVRSQVPLGINFTKNFELKSDGTGNFSLRTTSPLSLPAGRGALKLFVTVVCNDEAFPLFTVRMKGNKSDEAPKFYNEPYHVEVNESLSVGDMLETPVVVVNWESDDSPPKLYLEDSDSPFKVVTEERQNSLLSDIINQTTSREPTAVLLKLVKPITHLPITLKLVAENSQEHASETLIHLHGKPPEEKKPARAHASMIQVSRRKSRKKVK
uniref:Cadherin domain-containing protein n=1 Tax=Haemonchus contortus TaxID=6289 RepID=A0A6F7PH53_HAECO